MPALAWIGALVVFALTLLVFSPALEGGWLDWDDAPLLLERTEWRGFSPAQLGWMFTTVHMGPYQPLSWLSYALDHALWGMDPRGYHATNVLLHALSAVVLFALARELLRVAGERSGAAFARIGVEAGAALAALLWALHPLRVESVAWITERRDCLSGLFFLLALLCWTKHAQHDAQARSHGWLRLALAAFALSLFAKGMALVLPPVLLVLELWPFARRAGSPLAARVRAHLAECWAFWLLALAAGVVAVVGQKTTGAMVETGQHGLAARAAQAAYGLVFYVQKTLWPDGLMTLYPLPNPLVPGARPFVLAASVLAAAVVLLVTYRRRAPALAAALLAYALIVAPVLGFVQTGSQLVALRYSYLAALPLALLAGGVLLLLVRRFGLPVLAAGALVCVPLSIATARECRVWHDSFSIWERDLALDPSDSPARRSLIVACVDRGRAEKDPAARRAQLERALEQCREGLRHGEDAAYHLNAAKVYDLWSDDEPAQRAHWLELALEEARRSVAFVERSNQRLYEAYESCGALLAKLERPAEAVPYLRKLAELDPRSVQRLGMLGDALLQAGDAKEALAVLERARTLEPDSCAVWLEIGEARRRLGDRAGSLQAFRFVLDRRRAELGPATEGDADYESAARAIAELSAGR